MIDMFSMLVIFLLVNFSTSGELYYISKDIKIPQAEHARPIESLPLISITERAVIFDSKAMGDNPTHLEEADYNLPQLRAQLRRIKELQESLFPNRPFFGRVNVQADQNTPIIYVKRVMTTLIDEGWTGINFAVRPNGSREPAEEEEEE
jgi:biopolymer transport protein ExbD